MNAKTLTLSAAARDAIATTSRNAYPEEGCGYLIGRPATPRVDEARATRNVHPGPRTSRYLVDALEFLQIEEDLERHGLAILGVHHSHPGSPARPSATDLAAALPNLYYVIHDARGGADGPMRAWRLNDAGDAFDEVPLKTDT